MMPTSPLLCVEIMPDTSMPGGKKDFATPYERIIGVRTGNGETLYDQDIATTPDSPRQRSVLASPEFGQRFCSYWATRFCAPGVSLGRNCIDFALHMRDIPVPRPNWGIDESWVPTFRAIEELYDQGSEVRLEHAANLQMCAGSLAIIGSEQARQTGSEGDALIATNVLHTLVATGEDSSHPWLNVVSTKGALGFTVLSDSIDYLKNFTLPGQQEPAYRMDDISIRIVE